MLDLAVATVAGRGCQPQAAGQLAPVGETPPAEHLLDQHPGALRSDGAQPGQLGHQRLLAIGQPHCSGLRDYLARNLHILEPSLRLYTDEGITGVEFSVGGRFIDVLAVDQSGGYVVIELKVSKGYDRVVGQLLRYMSWIKKNHAEPGQTVRGIIIAKQISEDLRLACSELPSVSLYEYALSVAVRRVTADEQ